MTFYVLLHGYHDGSEDNVFPVLLDEREKVLIERILQAVSPSQWVNFVEIEDRLTPTTIPLPFDRPKP